jgi:hypothetical protein
MHASLWRLQIIQLHNTSEYLYTYSLSGQPSSSWTWQHQKRDNSARLPSNKCRADGLVPMLFVIFPFHLSKVLRLPRKSDARSYEVLHLSRKIIFPKLKIWCSGNQRPHLLTSLMNTSLVLRIPRKMHLARSSSYVPRLPLFLESYKTLTFCSLLTRCPIPRACHAKPHLNLQKWSEHVVFLCVFDILTWKCASRHNGMHFFNTTTSKSAPNPVCFVHFDFDMCFSPQRRAPSQLPNVVWDHQFFTLLTSSRHRGVKFFLSHLPRWLCTCCFSEPTFRPSRAANHGKTQCFATLLPFRAPAFSFFCFLTLSLLWSSFCFISLLWVFPPLLFHLSILSEVWLPNFLRL